MKIYFVVIIAVCALAAACSSPSSNSPQNQSLSALAAVSPTETMKALNEAARNKDNATLKNLVTKGTLALMEQNAKQQNTTVDALLAKGSGASFEELPEMRNEKITGETATVEVKDKSAEKWTTLPFAKEDGIWKVALDKFMQETMKQMTEQMKAPAGNSNKTANTDKSRSNK